MLCVQHSSLLLLEVADIPAADTADTAATTAAK
jgi:hypothetical protein